MKGGKGDKDETKGGVAEEFRKRWAALATVASLYHAQPEISRSGRGTPALSESSRIMLI
jgi:hypothetical protein